MSKPAHPATVHFPIAFLFLGYGLDILHTLRGSLPGFISNNLPVANDLTRASYYLLSIGLLSAIPAVISGGQQAVLMISKQGMYEADGKTIKNKVKATLAHAAVNDVLLALSTYIWYARRSVAAHSIAGKIGVSAVATPQAAYAPAGWMVAAEAASLALLLVGANIGGTLTYNFGVGFSSMSSGKKSQ